MESNIIQIGNSRGVILPSELLRRLNLSLKSPVDISLDGSHIIIKPQPRQGWSEAARQCHEAGDDALLIPDTADEKEMEDWTW